MASLPIFLASVHSVLILLSIAIFVLRRNTFKGFVAGTWLIWATIGYFAGSRSEEWEAMILLCFFGPLVTPMLAAKLVITHPFILIPPTLGALGVCFILQRVIARPFSSSLGASVIHGALILSGWLLTELVTFSLIQSYAAMTAKGEYSLQSRLAVSILLDNLDGGTTDPHAVLFNNCIRYTFSFQEIDFVPVVDTENSRHANDCED